MRATILWIVPIFALAQDKQDPCVKALDAVSSSKIKEHLTELAGDKYEGRNAGYPGCDKAAKYIVAFCEKIGLKPLGAKGTYYQTFNHTKQLTTRNILGYIEGSDLKSEAVVLGAHYDHAGKKGEGNEFARLKRKSDPKDDDIWNGADDNASGVSCLLEIARVLTASRLKFKRSVIFAWFSAEEWGLQGSKYYCANFPAEFPRERHVAMINLDMVGRNPDRPLSIGGVGTSDGWSKLFEACSGPAGVACTFGEYVDPCSDHYSFATASIPAVHLFSGFHSNFHRNTDHADLIDYDRTTKVARLTLLALAKAANAQIDLAWKQPPGLRDVARGKRLGIGGEDVDDAAANALGLAASDGGIRVTLVGESSSAERCGIKEGDVIVEFGGEKLPRGSTMTRLFELIAQAKYDVEIPVVVVRGSERVTVRAMLKE